MWECKQGPNWKWFSCYSETFRLRYIIARYNNCEKLLLEWILYVLAFAMPKMETHILAFCTFWDKNKRTHEMWDISLYNLHINTVVIHIWKCVLPNNLLYDMNLTKLWSLMYTANKYNKCIFVYSMYCTFAFPSHIWSNK